MFLHTNCQKLVPFALIGRKLPDMEHQLFIGRDNWYLLSGLKGSFCFWCVSRNYFHAGSYAPKTVASSFGEAPDSGCRHEKCLKHCIVPKPPANCSAKRNIYGNRYKQSEDANVLGAGFSIGNETVLVRLFPGQWLRPNYRENTGQCQGGGR